MKKSNKKFSVYTTELDYDRKSNSSKTIYNLIGETDDVNEVDELYKTAFKSEMEYFKSIDSNFKSYYTRCAMYTTEDCDDNLHLWYDYGSHSRFIEVHFLDRAACNEYMDLMMKQREEYENSRLGRDK